jgi:hypothetical protein
MMDLATLLQQATDARARRVVLVPGRPAVFRDDEGATPTGVVLDMNDLKALLKSALPGEMLRDMRWGSETPYQLEVDGRSWDLLIILSEDKELRVEMECRSPGSRRRRGGLQAGAAPQARVFGERLPGYGSGPGAASGGGAFLSSPQTLARASLAARSSLAAARVESLTPPAALRMQPQLGPQLVSPDLATPELIVRNSVANEPDYAMPPSLAQPASFAQSPAHAAHAARAEESPAHAAHAAHAEEPRALEVHGPAAERGTGLVYAADEASRERAVALLTAAGFGAQSSARAVDVAEALRYTTFPVVLLATAGALRDDPVYAALNDLPMARRRTLFVALLTAPGEAHDRMTAFAQSVDLCLPPAGPEEQAKRLLSELALWQGETHELREALAAHGRM